MAFINTVRTMIDFLTSFIVDVLMYITNITHKLYNSNSYIYLK